MKLSNRFEPLLRLEDSQELTEAFTQIMNETAEECLGKLKKKKQPWMTDKILEKCDERRKLRSNKYKNYDAFKEYQETNKEVKTEIRKAKEEFILRKCNDIQREFESNNTKVAYQVVKEIMGNKSARVSVIENKQGKLLTDKKAIQERWTEYVQELYTYPITTDDNILTQLNTGNSNEEEEPDILKTEIEQAIKELKVGKSAGCDNIPAELIKNGGDSTVNVLLKICNEVWRNKKWPTKWTQSLIITLPKKGNLRKCNKTEL